MTSILTKIALCSPQSEPGRRLRIRRQFKFGCKIGLIAAKTPFSRTNNLESEPVAAILRFFS